MIFIKFKKYIVVALAVLCVVVSSFVSAFALDDDLKNQDCFQIDKILSFLKNETTIYDKYVKQSDYQYITAFKSTRDDKYVFSVYFMRGNGSEWSEKMYSVSTYINSNFVANYSYYYDSNNDTYKYYDKFLNTDSAYENMGYISLSPSCILYSTVDLKTPDITFFQNPPGLLQRLLNPVQSLMGEKVVADLGTLTVCGIGCLALLVGCSLVPKVLHKFRV